jgi:regulator of sigma E protease
MAETVRNFWVFVALLGSTIVAHEVGHLLAAILCRVRVREIGVGIPPRLAKLGTVGGVQVTLNWIPLGGFVRPDGEFDPHKPGGLAASPALARIAILTAGSLANFLFALVILVVAFMAGGPDDALVRVVAVSPDSPAEHAGLEPGDLVLQTDGQPVQGKLALRSYIYGHLGQVVALRIQRGELVFETSLVPRSHWPEGEGAAGFSYLGAVTRYPLSQAIGEVVEELASMLEASRQAMAEGLSGEGGVAAFRLAGPVGLKQASDWTLENSVQWGVSYPVFYFAALLSIGLGMTNLLPFPALDGGRIAFAILEVVRRKPTDIRLEKRVHTVGLLVLLGIMLAVTVKDLVDPLF